MAKIKGRNKGHDNLIPIKKGERLNPNGRPLGQKNYATLFKEAIIKLAKLNNKEPDELELEIISKGILKAREGEYNFYKDVLDRLHGKAAEKLEVDNKGEITIKIVKYGDTNSFRLHSPSVSSTDTPSIGPRSEASDLDSSPEKR